MEMTDFLSPGYAAYRQAIPKSTILLWDMFSLNLFNIRELRLFCHAIDDHV